MSISPAAASTSARPAASVMSAATAVTVDAEALADLRGGGLQRLGAARVHHQIGARLGQRPRAAEPEPLRGRRHQCPLAPNAKIHRSAP
jgi:hypothetical protein